MKFMVVDDDQRVRDVVMIGLRLQWQDVAIVVADSGEAALTAFHHCDPDLVLLDIGLPDIEGYEVLRGIRAASDAPVIMLTARGDEMDQVRGLELGADDYIVKPFGHATLVARIRAVLRRAELPSPVRALPDLTIDDLAIDFATRRVTVGGHRVTLTPIEHRLLTHLARRVGRVVPHRALLTAVWGPDFPATNDNLKVLISRLRAKIERPGGSPCIETERGLGYSLIHRPGAETRPSPPAAGGPTAAVENPA
jgi:two-component system, OmpR family, KDP operon response regulator KdpE